MTAPMGAGTASFRRQTLNLALVTLAGLVLLPSQACKSRRQAEVEGIWIAQASGIQKAPEGETAPVLRREPLTLRTDEKVVRLAIARDVEWSQVRRLLNQIRKDGKTPVLLVADDRKVGAIELNEELEGEPLDIHVSVGGKVCVAPPNSIEAICVEQPNMRHVDRAGVRELVRRAVKGYKLHDAIVEVPPDLEWADLVRAVDGTRTCCFEEKVRVRLK